MSIDLRDTAASTGRLTLVGIICLLGQLCIAPNVSILQGTFNFALVFTACVAMSEGGDRAVLAGFVSGLIYDLSGSGPVGIMAFELSLAGFFVGQSGRNRFAEDRLELTQVFLMMAVAVQLFYQVLMFVVGQAASPLDALLYRALPSLLLDCIAFLPFALWFSRQVVAGSSLGFGNKKAHHGRFDTPGK